MLKLSLRVNQEVSDKDENKSNLPGLLLPQEIYETPQNYTHPVLLLLFNLLNLFNVLGLIITFNCLHSLDIWNSVYSIFV